MLRVGKSSYLSLFKILLILLCYFRIHLYRSDNINQIIYDQSNIINLNEYLNPIINVCTYSSVFLFMLNNCKTHKTKYKIRESEKRSLQIATNISDKSDEVHIILCSDEKDRLPMYVLINSIIHNERYVDRLYFHILVLENIPLFVSEFRRYFSEYFDQISFEFKSIKDDIPSCIEYNNIASKTLPEKQARNWLNNIMNFARFCAPNAFPDVNVGIYIDVDMIVQNSISALYDKYHRNDNNYMAWSVLNRSPYKIHFGRGRSDFNNYLNYNLSRKYDSIPSHQSILQI